MRVVPPNLSGSVHTHNTTSLKVTCTGIIIGVYLDSKNWVGIVIVWAGV